MFMIVVLAAILWGVSVFFNARNTIPVSQITPTPLRTPPPQPSLTPKRTVQAISSKTFSLLVSYTDQGFEPNAPAVQKGDMVRFANNSTHAMSLSLKGAPPDLPPGEYWEFTFDTPGTHALSEKTSGAEGSVSVQ